MKFEEKVTVMKTLLDCHKICAISEENMSSVTSLLVQTVKGQTVSHVRKYPVLLEAIKVFGFGGNKHYESKYADAKIRIKGVSSKNTWVDTTNLQNN